MSQPWPVLRLDRPGESWREVSQARGGQDGGQGLSQEKWVYGGGSQGRERWPERQTRGRVSVKKTDSKTQTLKIGRQTEK